MAKNLLQNSCDLALTGSTSGTAAAVTTQPLVLVQQQNPSASASVTFTNLANYPYKNYKITFRGKTGSSGNINLYVSTNNGASYVSGSYQAGANYILYLGTSFSTNQYTNLDFLLSVNTQIDSILIDVNLYNIGYAAPNFTCCSGSCTLYDGSTLYYNIITGSFLVSSIKVNALQITGQSMTGTFNLYGYNS